jgi:hypothetical protein
MTTIEILTVLPLNYLCSLKNLLDYIVQPGGRPNCLIGDSERMNTGTIMQCKIPLRVQTEW